MKQAKTFWQKQTKYPNYDNIKERRLYELNYLVPKLKGMNSLLDLGCGDGALIKCLRELTHIKKYYAYDYAKGLLKDIPAITKYYDCNEPKQLPKTDITILAVVLQFMEEDKIDNLLKRIKSDIVYIRSSCANKELRINTYSKQLKSNYESIYRTKKKTIEIISRHFKVKEVKRIYPNILESKYGHKQYVFYCII
jgi:hypothetical protein